MLSIYCVYNFKNWTYNILKPKISINDYVLKSLSFKNGLFYS